MKLDLLEVVAAISDLLDLAGIDHYLHGKRVATMATECAHILHLGPASHAGLVLAALLHDLGTTAAQSCTPLEVELESEGARLHCERGAWLLRELSPLSHLVPVIRYHHTHWEKLPKDLDPELGRDTNLIFLIDRVDALTAPHIGAADFHQHRDESRRVIAERSGSAFSPKLVEAFLKASVRSSFWYLEEPKDGLHESFGLVPQWTDFDYEELRDLARIFSILADGRNEGAMESSLRLSDLAYALASRLGLEPELVEKIAVAAVLHDIGGVSVLDALRERVRPDRTTVLHHTFRVYQILRSIHGFEDIVLWVAMHHESLERATDAPPPGDELPLPARILAVADACYTLAHEEAARNLPDSVLAKLKELGTAGRLDPRIVAELEEHQGIYWPLVA
ncbi:MAG TPA: HD domain-containing protein [Methylococcus sp.]|nr:HD domain-containing protein [Methylococcus sp.]